MKKVLTFCVLALLLGFVASPEADAARKQSVRKYAAKKSARAGSASRRDEPASAEKPAVVSVPRADVHGLNSASSERVSEVLLNDDFVVLRSDGEWAYGAIPSQKGYRGWVRQNQLSYAARPYVPQDAGIVQIRNAKTRLTSRDGASVQIFAGTRLPLVRKESRKFEVMLPDGSTAFVPEEAAWIETARSADEITPEDILQASKFSGSDYRWGGITSGGMDCSGFVYTAFRLNGIYLKRDSYLQAEEGRDVPLEELNPGDLVFFRSEKAQRINHVGIYIGNGNFIHASRTKKGVSVSSLADEHYRKNFAGARRILNQSSGVNGYKGQDPKSAEKT